MDYYGRLLKTYPSFTEDFVRFELDMLRGYAYHSWAIANDGWLQFAGVTPSGAQYIKQEINSLIAIAKRGHK